MSDKDKRRLVFSIVQFLNGELGSDLISEDAKEGLEVASQCLQTAYCMAPEDTHLEVSRTLFDVFSDATKNEPVSSRCFGILCTYYMAVLFESLSRMLPILAHTTTFS